MLRLRTPGKAKRAWLEGTAELFRQGVQLGLDFALKEKTSNRGKIHAATYETIRHLGLPSDYARMAVNGAVQLARSHFGLRKAKRKAGKPTVVQSQGIGLGVNAYTLVGTTLRVSTGRRGQYIWLPLCVPPHWRKRLEHVHGDAKLFCRGEDWYVMLPLRMPTTPTVCDGDGQATVIGVELGIVRLATAKHPNGLFIANGRPIRYRRERFAALRRRMQRHDRIDRVRAMKGRESRWMRDVNHQAGRPGQAVPPPGAGAGKAGRDPRPGAGQSTFQPHGLFLGLPAAGGLYRVQGCEGRGAGGICGSAQNQPYLPEVRPRYTGQPTRAEPLPMCGLRLPGQRRRGSLPQHRWRSGWTAAPGAA